MDSEGVDFVGTELPCPVGSYSFPGSVRTELDYELKTQLVFTENWLCGENSPHIWPEELLCISSKDIQGKNTQ